MSDADRSVGVGNTHPTDDDRQSYNELGEQITALIQKEWLYNGDGERLAVSITDFVSKRLSGLRSEVDRLTTEAAELRAQLRAADGTVV